MTLMRVRLIGISELPLKQEGLGPSHFPVAISLRLVLRNSTRHPDIFRKRLFFSSSHWCATPVRCLEEQLFAMWRSWQSLIVRALERWWIKLYPERSSNPTPVKIQVSEPEKVGFWVIICALPILFHHGWVKNCQSYGQECEYCAGRKMRSFVTIDGRMGNNTAQIMLQPFIQMWPRFVTASHEHKYFFGTIWIGTVSWSFKYASLPHRQLYWHCAAVAPPIRWF